MPNENEFIKVNAEYSSDYIHINVKNKEKIRFSQDIVAVVDTSGSMMTQASIKTTSGTVESGLSVIDIVKHALYTIIESLSPKDRFSLVIYSYEGKIVVPLGEATEEFKKDTKEKISFLKAHGQTNLWDGLLKGMDELKKKDIGNNQSIIMLTDGIPNIEPPRGHIETFKRYLDKNKGNFNLYTCGFGYNMDYQLLVDFAKMSYGSYSFIPDSGMVGTIFINLMTNIFTQQANKLTLTFSENLPVIKKSNFSHLGSYGQSIILKLDSTKKINWDEIVLKLTGYHFTFGDFEISLQPTFIEDENKFNFEKVRFIFNNFLEETLKTSKFNPKDFLKNIEDIPSNSMIKNLLEDLVQITEAFESKYYNKWGKYYLPSLLMAHQQGKCNNFKDPGVQNYQDNMFLEYQEKMEEIFTKLPPPTPSNNTKTLPKNFSMNTYYESNNPCYSPECLTTLENGSKIAVGDLKSGMKVQTEKGIATVELVVVSRVQNHQTLMCHFDSGLKITPYHPIRINNNWTYPCKLVKPVETRTSVIISVILDKHHILTVNNIATITLGHDLTDPKVQHNFFGSSQVKEQLQQHPTFNSGVVILPENSIKRDKNTNMICGFRF